jgi:hypothetical protein
MSIESSPIAQNRAVRAAVSIFFFVCVPLSLWQTSVHSKIFIAQDPALTATHLIENEFAFRTTLISHLVGTIAFLILTWLLYRVFSSVNKPLAMLMMIPIFLQFPVVFIMEAVNFNALMTIKSDARPSFDVTQQMEAAYFLLRLSRYTLGAEKIVFGLIFIPLGILLFLSRLVPRAIAVLFIIGGTGYVIDTCLYLLLQRPAYANIQSMKLISSAIYSLGFLWLLVKGINLQKDQRQVVQTSADLL